MCVGLCVCVCLSLCVRVDAAEDPTPVQTRLIWVWLSRLISKSLRMDENCGLAGLSEPRVMVYTCPTWIRSKKRSTVSPNAVARISPWGLLRPPHPAVPSGEMRIPPPTTTVVRPRTHRVVDQVKAEQLALAALVGEVPHLRLGKNARLDDPPVLIRVEALDGEDAHLLLAARGRVRRMVTVVGVGVAASARTIRALSAPPRALSNPRTVGPTDRGTTSSSIESRPAVGAGRAAKRLAAYADAADAADGCCCCWCCCCCGLTGW
jgi:hypothetical protein